MKPPQKTCPGCGSPIKTRKASCPTCAARHSPPPVDPFFIRVYNRIKYRHPSTNITPHYLEYLFLGQNRRCGYTNLPLELSIKCPKPPLRCASLDRIDSSKGYEIDNVI